MIAVDTNILIWGLDQKSNPGLEHKIALALKLFEHASKNRIPIVIPTLVLEEFLVHDTQEEREKALDKIDESFRLVTFDFRAAVLGGELAGTREYRKEIRETYGKTRQVVKSDISIIATAVVSGAARLVTGDNKGLKAMSKGKILVELLEEYVGNIEREEAAQEAAARAAEKAQPEPEPQSSHIFRRLNLE